MQADNFWDFCHILPIKGRFEVSFYGGQRLYDTMPDGIFPTLDEAIAFARKHSRFVNVLEAPPFGF